MKNFNLPGGLWYTIIGAATLLLVTYGPVDDPWVPIVLGVLGLIAKAISVATGTDIPKGVVPSPAGTLSAPQPVEKPNTVARILLG